VNDLAADDFDAYRVKVTVKNNKLLSAIERAGFKSCAEFCRWGELCPSQVGALIGLRIAPLTQNGDFSEAAKGVMQALGAAPSDLWTDEQLTMALKKNTGERVVSADSVQAMLANHNERMTLESPEDEVARLEAAEVVRGVLKTLRQSHQEVIRMRFEQDMSLDEIAAVMNLSRERIRQIEAQALRLMRHPSRYGLLSECLKVI
jgi:RNA polymerase sigma factor (sigma-70 family)